MPKTWTDNDKYRLLLAIIDTVAGDSKNPDWGVVAGKMGEGFTVESVRQKFQAIKKTAKDELVDGGTPAGTPRGRKRTAKADTPDGEYGAKTPKGKKRGTKAKSETTVADAMSDDGELASPKKKSKKTDTTRVTESETEKKGFTPMFPNLEKLKPEEDTHMGQADNESLDQELA